MTELRLILGELEDWEQRAECRNYPTSMFFPSDKGDGTDNSHVAKAKSICAVCPVQRQCLDYALANRIAYGVWGGKSERQRRVILKMKGAA